jgi:putative membrane protein
MKRWIQLTAAVGLALSVTACAGDKSPDATTGTGGTVGTSGTMAADAEFVEEQLAMGTAEVELGRLAQERGMHADVKEFAAMMVKDHQMAAEELKPIAARVRAAETAPRAADRDDHREKLEDLSKLSGHDFDKKYIEEMVDDHQEGVKDLESKAENAADPDVKQWAAKTLPKMREHLERAKDIQTRLNNAEAQPGGYDRK